MSDMLRREALKAANEDYNLKKLRQDMADAQRTRTALSATINSSGSPSTIRKLTGELSEIDSRIIRLSRENKEAYNKFIDEYIHAKTPENPQSTKRAHSVTEQTARQLSRGRSRPRADISKLPPGFDVAEEEKVTPPLTPVAAAAPKSSVKPPLQFLQPTTRPTPASTTTHTIDPYMESYLAYLRDRTKELLDQAQFTPYPQDIRFAEINPHEKAAERLSSNPENVEEYKRYLRDAELMNLQAGRSTPSDIQDYLSPYHEHVVNRITELGKRHLAEQLLPTLEARFIRAGQYGSSAHQRLANNALRDIGAEISAQRNLALHQGYGQAAEMLAKDRERQSEMAKVQATLGQTMQAQRLNEINALAKLGAQQRERQQNVADFGYDEWVRQQAHPFEQMQVLGSTVRGQPHSTQTYFQGVPQPPPRRSFNSSDWGKGFMAAVPHFLGAFNK